MARPPLAASSAVFPDASKGGLDFNRLGEHGLQVETKLPEHIQRHDAGSTQQHHRLDDLHPGRSCHAAKHHIGHHEDTHHNH